MLVPHWFYRPFSVKSMSLLLSQSLRKWQYWKGYWWSGQTSVSDVAGSAGAGTAVSLGLLAELAITADSIYEFNIESKAVRVCQSVQHPICSAGYQVVPPLFS